MSTETQSVIVMAILSFLLWILISGVLWWIVLWSFEFPILFAWKQVIGVAIITSAFNKTKIITKNKNKRK